MKNELNTAKGIVNGAILGVVFWLIVFVLWELCYNI